MTHHKLVWPLRDRVPREPAPAGEEAAAIVAAGEAVDVKDDFE
jgi:hypothetical protein